MVLIKKLIENGGIISYLTSLFYRFFYITHTIRYFTSFTLDTAKIAYARPPFPCRFFISTKKFFTHHPPSHRKPTSIR